MLQYLQKISINSFRSSNKLFYGLSNDRSNLDYEKAYLADKTIKMITTAWSNDIKQISLKDQILKMLNKDTKTSQQAKNELLMLFDGGIQLQPQIYSQKFKLQKVKFVPTHFITGQIFDYLLNRQAQSKLVQGLSGIGKSFSFILFTKLSNLILKHKMMNTEGQNNADLLLDVPKLIHYPIRYQPQKQQVVYKRLLNQMSEITEATSENLESMKIKQQYNKKSVKLFLVADEVDNLIIKSLDQEENTQNKQMQFLRKIRKKFDKLIQINSTFKQYSVLATTETSEKLRQGKHFYVDYSYQVNSIFQRSDQDDEGYQVLKQKQHNQLYQVGDLFLHQLSNKIHFKHFPNNWYNSLTKQYLEIKEKLRRLILDYNDEYFLPTPGDFKQYFDSLSLKKLRKFSLSQTIKNLQSQHQEGQQHEIEQQLAYIETKTQEQLKKDLLVNIESVQQLRKQIRLIMNKIQECSRQKLNKQLNQFTLLDRPQDRYRYQILAYFWTCSRGICFIKHDPKFDYKGRVLQPFRSVKLALYRQQRSIRPHLEYISQKYFAINTKRQSITMMIHYNVMFWAVQDKTNQFHHYTSSILIERLGGNRKVGNKFFKPNR